MSLDIVYTRLSWTQPAVWWVANSWSRVLGQNAKNLNGFAVTRDFPWLWVICTFFGDRDRYIYISVVFKIRQFVEKFVPAPNCSLAIIMKQFLPRFHWIRTCWCVPGRRRSHRVVLLVWSLKKTIWRLEKAALILPARYLEWMMATTGAFHD